MMDTGYQIPDKSLFSIPKFLVMKKLLLGIFQILLSFISSAQTPSFISDSLDSYIKRGISDWNIPGLAIAIVKDGKVVLMKGYGVREVGNSEPVDENTLFIIASNTKLFTATSLAKLENERKISLDDRVTKYIPWFRLYDSNVTRMVTIRDLLCHRLGTKTFQGDFTFWNSNIPRDSIIWKMRLLRPTQQYRQDYGYCNSAFLAAGQIIPAVTGMNWENYVQENLLRPLGMNNTYMLTAGIEKRNNVAVPYSNAFGALSKLPYDQIDNLGPATSMVSCVSDLTHWLLMQLDSGRYQGQTIVPWAVVQKTRDANIMTGSRRSAFYPTHFRAYGLGENMTDYNGRQVFWHTGGAFGFVTNVCFVPEEKLGITILTNNDNQNFFEALRYQILDAYLGVPYTNRSRFQMGFALQTKTESERSIRTMKERVQKKNKPDNLDQFTGDYDNELYGRISISRDGDKLKMNFSKHPNLTASLEYMDNNSFMMTYSNIAYGIFAANFKMANGKANAVEIKMNDFVEFDPYTFTRK